MLLAAGALAEERSPAAFMTVVYEHLLSIAERADREFMQSVQEVVYQETHILALVL